MRSFVCTGVLSAALLVPFGGLQPRAAAQHGGGHGGGGMGGGMPGAAGNRGFGGGGNYGAGIYSRGNVGTSPNRAPDSAGTVSPLRGGLQLGPPGRWWDDKLFAKDLKLRSDQQRRMDGIFESNRSVLLKRFEDYQTEQSKLETLTHARIPDEGALYVQIDRVAQARAELEKANAHYLLQLRNEMDQGQISSLEDHR